MRASAMFVLSVGLTACVDHSASEPSALESVPETEPACGVDLVQLSIRGEIVQLDVREGNVNVQLGDAFKGLITYDANAIDTGGGFNRSAIYEFSTVPYGISIDINNVTYETEADQVDFLINVVDRPEDFDAIVFHSYVNRPSKVEHISWQIEDYTSSAHDSVELPRSAPDLSRYDQLFGLTIHGAEHEWFVRGVVTEAARLP